MTQLPHELLWTEDGHASDVVLTSLADGEHDIVPQDVRAHVAACTTCALQLGNAALLSLRTTDMLGTWREAELAALREPFPWRTFWLGLSVACAAAFVHFAQSPLRWLRMPFDVWDSVRVAARHAPALLKWQSAEAGPVWLLLTFSSATLCVALSVWVARQATHQGAVR